MKRTGSLEKDDNTNGEGGDDQVACNASELDQGTKTVTALPSKGMSISVLQTVKYKWFDIAQCNP
jgi:hypothetical protein